MGRLTEKVNRHLRLTIIYAKKRRAIHLRIARPRILTTDWQLTH